MRPFDDVADTALWVAAYRAIESERADALFRDPLAAHLYHVEEGERRGRRVPLPAWMRLAYAFMPKKRKEAVRKMMGFGLLEKI